MENRYEKRAKEIYSKFYTGNDEDNIIAMCKLAEEVERETTKMNSMVGLDLLIAQKRTLYSKEQAEELLEKQRELSAEKADMCDENGNTASTLYKCDAYNYEREWTVNKDSIKNAKLKF